MDEKDWFNVFEKQTISSPAFFGKRNIRSNIATTSAAAADKAEWGSLEACRSLVITAPFLVTVGVQHTTTATLD